MSNELLNLFYATAFLVQTVVFIALMVAIYCMFYRVVKLACRVVTFPMKVIIGCFTFVVCALSIFFVSVIGIIV